MLAIIYNSRIATHTAANNTMTVIVISFLYRHVALLMTWIVWSNNNNNSSYVTIHQSNISNLKINSRSKVIKNHTQIMTILILIEISCRNITMPITLPLFYFPKCNYQIMLIIHSIIVIPVDILANKLSLQITKSVTVIMLMMKIVYQVLIHSSLSETWSITLRFHHSAPSSEPILIVCSMTWCVNFTSVVKTCLK